MPRNREPPSKPPNADGSESGDPAVSLFRKFALATVAEARDMFDALYRLLHADLVTEWRRRRKRKHPPLRVSNDLTESNLAGATWVVIWTDAARYEAKPQGDPAREREALIEWACNLTESRLCDEDRRERRKMRSALDNMLLTEHPAIASTEISDLAHPADPTVAARGRMADVARLLTKADRDIWYEYGLALQRVLVRPRRRRATLAPHDAELGRGEARWEWRILNGGIQDLANRTGLPVEVLKKRLTRLRNRLNNIATAIYQPSLRPGNDSDAI